MSSISKNKDSFIIDLSKKAKSSLVCQSLLTTVDPSKCNHVTNGLRLPLGIYNVSILRITQKLSKVCDRLEQYINISGDLAVLNEHSELRAEIIDYIELSLYAAAEHVDDVMAIANGFFDLKRKASKDDTCKKFQSDIKEHKKFISATANAIKHQQARIRLYSREFSHSGVQSCLHGYFIEGVNAGVVGPNVIFHQTQKVFSITTLAWEILFFVLKCSRTLHDFLQNIPQLPATMTDNGSENFSKAVISAVRLPLYTFDEDHPFLRATVILTSDDEAKKAIKSKIYGSLSNKWSDSETVTFGKANSEFEGDGVTRSFQLASPSRTTLQHWQ